MNALTLFFLSLVVLSVLPVRSVAQTPPAAAAQPPQALSLDEVVRLAKAGLSEDLIIARIKRNAKPFDLSSAEIVELQQLGVSQTILKYLIDPALPYTPPPPPTASAGPVAPAPSPVKPPSDPRVLKIPPEMGLYWLNQDQPVQLELKPVVVSKQGGKSKLLLGLKKGHNIGSLAGTAAKTKLPAGGGALYARVQTPIEDLVLVKLDIDEVRRDLDFGPKAAKPSFPPKSVHQFESKDVGQGVVRITLPTLDFGEYLLFILGSGEEKKGTLGKGWEFGVR